MRVASQEGGKLKQSIKQALCSWNSETEVWNQTRVELDWGKESLNFLSAKLLLGGESHAALRWLCKRKSTQSVLHLFQVEKREARRAEQRVAGDARKNK